MSPASLSYSSRIALFVPSGYASSLTPSAPSYLGLVSPIGASYGKCHFAVLMISPVWVSMTFRHSTGTVLEEVRSRSDASNSAARRAGSETS